MLYNNSGWSDTDLTTRIFIQPPGIRGALSKARHHVGMPSRSTLKLLLDNYLWVGKGLNVNHIDAVFELMHTSPCERR
jgi:hypothetical protein